MKALLLTMSVHGLLCWGENPIKQCRETARFERYESCLQWIAKWRPDKGYFACHWKDGEADLYVRMNNE